MSKKDVTTASSPWRRWQDWMMVILGGWLFVSSVLSAGHGAYDLAARIAGALVVGFALWGLSAPASQFPRWACIVVGAAVVIVPNVLGYLVNSAVAWNTYLTGLLLIVLAVWSRDRALEGRS